MKLAILTQYFYPETGAPQNRLYELSKKFKEYGWEVMVITGMPNYPKGKIFPGYRWKFCCSEKIDTIDVNRYWLFASNSKNKLPRIISMISFSLSSLFICFRLKKFKPDFLFIESPPLTLGYSGYLLSKYSGAKMIMNVSDIWPLSAKELGAIGNGKIYRKLESLEKFLYGKAFINTGQSEEIVSHINNSGDFNTYLFRNGVDVKRFEKPKSYCQSGEIIKIVYAGLLGVAQGIFEIVSKINFKELGAEFHIYGEGTDRKATLDFLKENPDRGIVVHKSVKSNEIPEILTEYYCTIIPLVNKIYGAVPSKIYEAMAAGVPILFSGSGEGAAIISDNNIGLVSSPRDFDKLKENIIKLRDSLSLRNEMSENCRKTAEEKFDRNDLIKKFSDKLVSYIN